MPRPATDKRKRLTAAALDLAYRSGLEATSLADIAREAGISAGSVYYYFKTKEDMGAAVVGELAERYGDLMRGWQELTDPRDRLSALVQAYARDADLVSRWGCPLGSVVADLSKQSPELGSRAGEVLERLVGWCGDQFAELGYTADAARARAVHLVSVLQGASSLAKALGTADPLLQETEHVERWIRRSGD